MKKKFTPRFEQILCKCGCGKYFTAAVTTKPPQFMNETHRKRWTRKNQRERKEKSDSASSQIYAALIKSREQMIDLHQRELARLKARA